MRRSRGSWRRWAVLPVILLLLIAGGAILAKHTYNQYLQPVSSDSTSRQVTIQSGSTTKQIGAKLQSEHLIRSAWAFELYVHGKGLGSKLQAGTYALAPNQGTIGIVKTLTKGAVQTNLVTIFPGRRIDQVRADLINAGFSPGSVDKALQPDQYSDLPVLAYKPAGVNTLEGLLYPDSFQKDAATNPSVIIRQSLQEMGGYLGPDLQTAFANEGLQPYQAIILASIIEKEVANPGDRTQAAQVFLKRLSLNMPLGSDVTAIYGAINAGQTQLSQAAMLAYDTPYNTLLHQGYPPTPIGSVSNSSLQAVAHPANTDWLYFVSGDNGNTYFSHTAAEHDQQAQTYCHKLCGR